MHIQINEQQLYSVKNATWSPVDVLPSEVTKLSLFNNEDFISQKNAIKQLLSIIDSEVFTRLDAYNENLHWTIYADYSVLKKIQVDLNITQFDYLLWPEGQVEPPKLMLFDMDSTFIQIEVIDELAKHHNVGEAVSKVTEAAMRGELDFAQSLITRVACLKGLRSDTIEKIASQLPLSKGVTKLVAAGKNNACNTAIVSGGFTPFVDKLKNDLNLYRVKANHLEIKDDKLTGVVLGDIVDAKAKADFLESLCESLEITPNQVIAIGDGANDLLMMKAAGFNLAYQAKPKVQQQANGRINFSTLARLINVFQW